MMILMQIWLASTVVLAVVLAFVVVSQTAWRIVSAPWRSRVSTLPTVITLPTGPATPAQRTSAQAAEHLLDV